MVSKVIRFPLHILQILPTYPYLRYHPYWMGYVGMEREPYPHSVWAYLVTQIPHSPRIPYPGGPPHPLYHTYPGYGSRIWCGLILPYSPYPLYYV